MYSYPPKKKYDTGIYRGVEIFIAAINDKYALISYTDKDKKLFKVDINELTALK